MLKESKLSAGGAAPQQNIIVKNHRCNEDSILFCLIYNNIPYKFMYRLFIDLIKNRRTLILSHFSRDSPIKCPRMVIFSNRILLDRLNKAHSHKQGRSQTIQNEGVAKGTRGRAGGLTGTQSGRVSATPPPPRATPLLIKPDLVIPVSSLPG